MLDSGIALLALILTFLRTCLCTLSYPLNCSKSVTIHNGEKTLLSVGYIKR